MNTKLLEFLIKKFTKEGETVLDPMMGSGSTLVVSALLGRNAVGVELERKFVNWCEEAKRKVETQQTLARKGRIRNVLGDARRLSELLEKADVVVSSPPYSLSLSTVKTGRGKTGKGEQKIQKEKGLMKPYSLGRNNIGNLRHGKVDVVVTSPPYSEAQDGHGIAKKGYRGNKHSPTDLVGNRSYMPDKFENPQNISRLRHGKVDSIITSPPYANSKKGNEDEERMASNLEKFGETQETRRNRHTPGRLRAMKSMVSGYSESEENIGNLKFADVVITSPPYGHESIVGAGNKSKIIKEKFNAVPYDETEYGRKRDIKTGKYLPTKIDANIARLSFNNQDYPNNVTTPKKETYLQAMLTVYREMYAVLKPQGKAIIIIKPFIRNKKVVDLPYQTWLLLKRAGFKLTSLFKLRLKQQSFWRILYSRKFPDVPKILHEYILVTQKS